MRTSLLVLLGWLNFACQNTGSRKLSDLSIHGGRAVANTDPLLRHTVALVDPDPSIGVFCSAVVIGKRHILTAAHCFNNEHRIPYALFEREYEADNEPAVGHALMLVELVAVHGGYSREKADAYDQRIIQARNPEQIPSPGEPLYDLAIGLLEHDIPEPYQAVSLDKADDDKASIVAAGYGCQTTLCDETTSRLRRVEMKIIKTLPDAHLVVLAGGRGKGTCWGDSGGPEFRVKGSSISLLAIISTGPQSCEAGIAVDTLVAPYRGWIEKGFRVLAKPLLVEDAYRLIDYTQAE